MGLFDKVTQKAAGLAGDAATAGTVGAAQVKLKSLEGAADDAKRIVAAYEEMTARIQSVSHLSPLKVIAVVTLTIAISIAFLTPYLI